MTNIKKEIDFDVEASKELGKQNEIDKKLIQDKIDLFEAKRKEHLKKIEALQAKYKVHNE